MTLVAAAMIVTDAKKEAACVALSAIANDGIGFIRVCCPINPPPTWETPHTHWYNNFASADSSLVAAWQDAVDAAEPEDPLYGLQIFTAQNITNYVAWSVTNLGSQGLMMVPDMPEEE